MRPRRWLASDRGVTLQHPEGRLVSVELHDGRIFDPIVVSEGCVIQVQGYEEIPFVPSAIRSIKPSQKRWNFRRSYKGQDVLRRAASA